MLGGLISILGGPLIKAVMGPLDTYFKQKGMSQRSIDKIRGEVETALYDQLGSISDAQANAIKAEMNSGFWLAANWRALGSLAFISVFLFYALWVPITVAYFGWPAPRIGDQLLSWIFDLLKIAMSGYVGIAALDKVLTTTHRGRVR